MTFYDLGVYLTAVAVVALILYVIRIPLARFLGGIKGASRGISREVRAAYREAEREHRNPREFETKE
jgi:hypothetical protein